MKLFLKYHGPATLWALFILYICSADLGSVDKAPMFFAGFDKLTHCGLFFTFTVLLSFGIIKQQRPRPFTYKKAIVVLAASIFYGGFIEILQLEFFTWRTADWNDMFCDVLGACMGIFGVMLTVWAIGNEKK